MGEVREGPATGDLGAIEARRDRATRHPLDVIGAAPSRASRGIEGGSPRRLTVCHVFSGDLWAGAEVMIFNLLSALGADPRVRIIALSLNEGVLTEKLRAAGITTHVIPETRHTLAGILWRAGRLLRGSGVDVLHSHRYKENVLAWLLGRWLRVSGLVTTIHGLPEATTPDAHERRMARWRARLDYDVVRRAFTSAVAVSNDMKRVLVQRYGFPEDRVRVIRNGGRFPPPPVPARSPGTTFHVGTVGRLVPIKGLDLFLEVAAALRRESRAVRFSILGDGPLREELSRKACALDLGDCVEFVTPRLDPFGYYQSLDVYLNTSVHEGLPLSVVEAMASGKPVVSAAVGGIPEIVQHGQHGFLVEGRQPEPFVECCLTLMRDEPLRAAMGERAAAEAHSRLSAAAMADAYRDLYLALPQRPGGFEGTRL